MSRKKIKIKKSKPKLEGHSLIKNPVGHDPRLSRMVQAEIDKAQKIHGRNALLNISVAHQAGCPALWMGEKQICVCDPFINITPKGMVTVDRSGVGRIARY